MSIVSPFIGDFLTPVGQPLVLSPLVNGLRAEFDQQQFRINGGGVLFDTAFDITRSSSKYVYGTGAQTGQLIEVPPNTPAYQHDPVTGAPKGLSVEGSATNLLLYSRDFTNANWQKLALGAASAPIVTANYAESVDGTMSATRVQMQTNSNTFSDRCILRQNYGSIAGGKSGSVFIKSNTGASQNIGIHDGGVNKTVVVDNNWQRFEGSIIEEAIYFGIELRGTVTDTVADILIDFSQLEVGDKATSPIPTVASTVTRAADIVTSDAATFGDWFTSNPFTVIVEWIDGIPAGANTSTPTVFNFNDGTTSNRLLLFRTGDSISVQTRDAGASTNLTTSPVNILGRNRVAVKFDTSSCAYSANGGAVVSGSSTVSLALMSSMLLGSRENFYYLNGSIVNLSVIDGLLSDAELQQRSAL